MTQSHPSRSRHRSPILALALLVLAVAVAELRRRAMRRNEAHFRAQYDAIARP